MKILWLAFFLTIRNEAKTTLITIPYDEQSLNREKKTRENLFSHSQFSSHAEKAEHFLILSKRDSKPGKTASE